MKDLFQKISSVYEYYQKSKSIQLVQVVQCFQNLLTTTVEVSRQQYYTWISGKLVDPRTSSKTQSLLVETFLNRKEMQCILPP